jgi:hypothetical protein
MTRAEPNCFERVSLLCEKLNSTEKGHAALEKLDQIIQFEIKESEPFRMEVKDGHASVAKGALSGVPLQQNLLIRTDAPTLNSLLERKLSLGDAIYERKLWVYGNVLKGAEMAWFSQLLRLNV